MNLVSEQSEQSSQDIGQWTLRHVLERQAGRTPDAPCLGLVEGPVHSYGEVWRRSRRLARQLQGLGIEKGQHVLLLGGNTLEVVYAWFALDLIGAVNIPINPGLRGQPLAHAIAASGAHVCLSEHALMPLALSQRGDLRAVYGFDAVPAAWQAPDAEGVTLGSLMPEAGDGEEAGEWTPPPLAGQDRAAILYTSGTSGPAKGVIVPHAQAYLIGLTTARGLRVEARDVIYCSHPLFHMSPRYCAIYAALQVGASVRLDVRFDAARWLQRIREAGATVTIAHGPMLQMVYDRPERPDDADNPLRCFGTSPYPRHIAEDFNRRFGVKGIEVWGMTEVGNVCWHPYDGPHRAGSCGLPLEAYYDFRVVDPDTDEELAPGEVGEFVVRPRRPWTINQGYFGRDAATVESWRNGWFHSGDTGYRDAEGWVYFVDRAKERIRRRAENISSYDIESAVREFPGVSDCAAVGVASSFSSDDDIKVCVVGAVEPEALLRFLATRLPHYMVPRYIECLEALPRTPTQKIRKDQLRQAGVGLSTWDRAASGLKLKDLTRGE